jgi:hypothetical protein
MQGTLNLTEPSHLLKKLEHELQSFASDLSNSYAAINALRDAYHLREWVWHGRLENDYALQTAIVGNSATEEDWNCWVNQNFPDFRIIRALCNGSKHFQPGRVVQGYRQAGLSGSFTLSHDFKLDDSGFYIDVDTNRIVSVVDLLNRVRDFWTGLFKQFPGLG